MTDEEAAVIDAEQDEQAQKKERYLQAFAKTGTLTAGCKAARVSPHTVYQWREMDDAFVFAERDAASKFADALEEEAVRRAWHGVDKPVYQGGELVGTIRERSDTLLIFMLKATRPDKYRDRHDITSGGEPIRSATSEIDQAITRRLEEMAARGESPLSVAPDRAPESTDA